MAIEFARVNVISRSSGHSAIKASAYRAGEKFRDERTGLVADYSHRAAEVVHSAILLPAGADPALSDRHALWTAIELREDQHKRHASAQLAKDHIVALPKELTLADQISLAERFAKTEFVSKGLVVDVNIHLHSDGNPHAHLMVTTRALDGDTFGNKCRELNGGFYGGRKVPDAEQLRHRWADCQNQFFQERDLSLLVINNNRDLPAELHLGPQVTALEKAGVMTEKGLLNQAKIAERHATLLAKPGIIIDRVSAHKSVFTRHDLYRELANQVDDADVYGQIKIKLDAHRDLIQILDPARGEFFTTQQVLETEQRIRGQGELLDRADAAFALSAKTRESVLWGYDHLSDEQRLAAEHLTEDRRLGIVIGLAGAGKSTMLEAVKAIYSETGHRVTGVALAGKAADELQHSAGIASRTIHSWLLALDHERETIQRGDVIVMDEAGMVNNALMQRVLDRVARSGAKLILVGDPEQLQPIQAGCPLRDLAEQTGHVDITTIRRQHVEWQRAATYQLAQGKGAAALSAYDAHGHVHRQATRAAAIDQLIQDYLRDDPTRAGSQAILAHRHVDVATINAQVRDSLMAAGRLAAGTVLRAEATAEQPARSLDISVGDRVLFTKNDRQLGVKNGVLGSVVGLHGNQLQIKTDAGKRVSFSYSDYAHLQHGYAMTIHKSQGVTVDQAYVLGSRTMDKHLGYVSLSRHRDSVQVYLGEEDFQGRSFSRCISTANRQESVLSFAERHGLESLDVVQARHTLAQTQQSLFEAARAAQVDEIARLEQAQRRAQSDVAYHAQFRYQKKPLLVSTARYADWQQQYNDAERAHTNASMALAKREEALGTLDMRGPRQFIRQAEQRHPEAALVVKEHGLMEKAQSLLDKSTALERSIADERRTRNDPGTLKRYYDSLEFNQRTLREDPTLSRQLSATQRETLARAHEAVKKAYEQVKALARERGRGMER